jgi:hypothetical protein
MKVGLDGFVAAGTLGEVVLAGPSATPCQANMSSHDRAQEWRRRRDKISPETESMIRSGPLNLVQCLGATPSGPVIGEPDNAVIETFAQL